MSAIQTVRELLDAEVLTDLGPRRVGRRKQHEHDDTDSVVYIGCRAEPGAGIHAATYTPAFYTSAQLERYCAKHLRRVQRHADADTLPDGLIGEWPK